MQGGGKGSSETGLGKSGRRKRSALSRGSSKENNSQSFTPRNKRTWVQCLTRSVVVATSVHYDEHPSNPDVRKLLKGVKANTNKLADDAEILKESYNHFKESTLHEVN